jgi:hypothetical protein
MPSRVFVLGERWLPSTVQAVGQVEGGSEVAGPERVAASTVTSAAVLHLVHSVHRERARSREPSLVPLRGSSRR